MSDMFAWMYSDVVKDHFMNPRNVFSPDENFSYDAEGITGSVKCGDQMQFMLKIKDDVIEDVRWRTYGCASAIASTSTSGSPRDIASVASRIRATQSV